MSYATIAESAVAAGITDPGADEGVITDGMILAGVQAALQPAEAEAEVAG